MANLRRAIEIAEWFEFRYEDPIGSNEAWIEHDRIVSELKGLKSSL